MTDVKYGSASSAMKMFLGDSLGIVNRQMIS